MAGTIHMLCGFIGSGKTTFAKQLEHDKNAFRFNLDYPMVALFGTNPPQETFGQYRDAIDAINLTYARRLLEIGVDVIFDYGFWGRSRRDEYRAYAADCKAELILYYIETPENIMRQRAISRPVDSETLLIEAATWDNLRQYFEPPHPDENFIRVDGMSVQ